MFQRFDSSYYSHVKWNLCTVIIKCASFSNPIKRSLWSLNAKWLYYNDVIIAVSWRNKQVSVMLVRVCHKWSMQILTISLQSSSICCKVLKIYKVRQNSAWSQVRLYIILFSRCQSQSGILFSFFVTRERYRRKSWVYCWSRLPLPQEQPYSLVKDHFRIYCLERQVSSVITARRIKINSVQKFLFDCSY